MFFWGGDSIVKGGKYCSYKMLLKNLTHDANIQKEASSMKSNLEQPVCVLRRRMAAIKKMDTCAQATPRVWCAHFYLIRFNASGACSLFDPQCLTLPPTFCMPRWRPISLSLPPMLCCLSLQFTKQDLLIGSMYRRDRYHRH